MAVTLRNVNTWQKQNPLSLTQVIERDDAHKYPKMTNDAFGKSLLILIIHMTYQARVIIDA